MGTFSPAKVLTPELEQQVRRDVMERFLDGLRAEGIAYNGLLFPGLMLTNEGVKVLEFNSRFGDPETQVLLARMKSDLVDLIEATIDGRLEGKSIEWDSRAAVCVVMASGGYPGDYEKGKPIGGLDEFAAAEDVIVFHAGTKLENGQVVTAGGRVLGVTALGADLRAAKERAYEAVRRICFEGCQYRTDIAEKGLLG
jgi:phosphoribosylamine--glycine ligase